MNFDLLDYLRKRSNDKGLIPKTFYHATILTALAAFFIKSYIALKTTGTNDILFWKMFITIDKLYGGIGLYQKLSWYNHPPMMIHCLRIVNYLATTLGIRFEFLFRLLPSLADLGSVFLVYKILKPTNHLSFPSLLLFALTPVLIMVSGFHGNTDPIMIFFVLLSIYFLGLEVKGKINNFHLAGLALALALSVKIVPIILIPTIFFYLPNKKSRLEYFTAVLLCGIVISLPFIFQDPIQIFKNTFGYKSFYGYWGITKFFSLFPTDHWIHKFYNNNGKFLIALLILVFSIWVNRGEKRPLLFFQVGFVFFLFMFLTPGFSVQYLVWLTPWGVGLGLEATLIYWVSSGLFLFLVYNWWAAGLPWEFASADAGAWEGVIYNYETICYASVVIITASLFAYITTEKYPKLKTHLTLFYQEKFRYSFLAVLVILITGKFTNDIILGYSPRLHVVEGENHEIRKKLLFSASYASVSALYLKAEIYDEFIKSCNQALAFNPDNADCYSLLCSYYIHLKEWDKAIEAGKKAVKLNPLLQGVRKNIVLAEQQKQETYTISTP